MLHFNIRPTAALVAKQTKDEYIDLMFLPIQDVVLLGILQSSGHWAASPWSHQGAGPQQVRTGLAGCFITLNLLGLARVLLRWTPSLLQRGRLGGPDFLRCMRTDYNNCCGG